MKLPTLKEEKQLWKKSYRVVVGLDEAGRGPLAGPVVAGAVTVKSNIGYKKSKIFKGVRDSKKLTPKQRERFFEAMEKSPEIEWGIGRVSERVIDKINILEATKLAMKRALANLIKKVPGLEIDFLLIDGNFGLDTNIPQKSIVKADEKVLSCSLASVAAKFQRDRIMAALHQKYPIYRFDRHKGYGTALHLLLLREHGPSLVHRASFSPLKKLL